MHVRPATLADLEAIAAMCAALWPDGSLAEHREELRALLSGERVSTMPLAVFVAEEAGTLLGFVEVGLRSHADGCDMRKSVGFIEGWYVVAERRRVGIGRALIERAEAWSRAYGCEELGSDTWIDNQPSQRAHSALGFELVDRCVNYRKPLAPSAPPPLAYYGPELARVHHDHFGTLARAAARELLRRLRAAGFSSGTIVDLAAGSGIVSRAACDAGYDSFGVDSSEAMLALAHAEAPRAQFVVGSLWNVELPPCIAVAAIGEAFSYAADPAVSLRALEGRLSTIRCALVPGGFLLFDVAGPGRSGASGIRRAFFEYERGFLTLSEREDREASELTRDIGVFVPQASLYRRVSERHVLRCYPPEAIGRTLSAAGFRWERLAGYDDFELMPGWHAYAAYAEGGPR